MATDAGYLYLMARAADADGRAASVLEDIGRYGSRGDATLEGQSRRGLDELIYRRVDGRPAYIPADVTRAAAEVYERCLTRQAAAALGRRGRAVNSEAQQASARENGAKGGRPKGGTT